MGLKDPEKQRAYDKIRDATPERKAAHAAYAMRRRAEPRAPRPYARVNQKLAKRYGIGLDDYDKMLSSQGGMCAICGTSKTTKARFCIDHDHSTGKVRGLLCQTCNNLLGRAHDDPLTLDRAIGYLNEFG